MVLDLEEDNRGGAETGEGEENPVGDEFAFVGELVRVEGPHDGRAGGLDTLVKTDVVGGATARVGESAHEPILVVSLIIPTK